MMAGGGMRLSSKTLV